jgi:hypothetical protein
MTQTITRLNNNSPHHTTVDVYYHPNNPKAKLDDSKIKLRYTVQILQRPVADEIQIVMENNDIDLVIEIATKASKGKVWVLESDDQDICEEDRYHATKKDAIAAARSQTV